MIPQIKGSNKEKSRNKVGNKDDIGRVKQTKNWFFQKSNKIDKLGDICCVDSAPTSKDISQIS